MNSVVIDYDTDESFTVYIDGEYVVSANHDEDGWAGMTKVKRTVEAFAHAVGIKIREEGDPNV